MAVTIISSDTVWAAGSVHDLGFDTLQIAPNVTLTIQAGAIVSAPEAAGIEVFGTLDVEGSAVAPVDFNNIWTGAAANGASITVNHAILTGGAFDYPTGNADSHSLTLTNSIFENVGEPGSSQGYSYIWYPTAVLGRVDGFDQDEAESKRDERAVILRGLLASKRDTLEALELADRLFDACPRFVECFRKEYWNVFGVGSIRDCWAYSALAGGLTV